MKLQSINRYEAYKDSGVEWLGEVPEHWEIVRNKDIFEERGSLSSSGDETLLTVSHITGVTRRSEKNVNMFMAETMEGYKHCKEGDLIINTMWAWMGALGTANEAGICSPAYGVYKPKKYKSYNRRYFDYLYRTPNAITEMTRNSKGIVSSRLRLYPKDFFQILTALPVEIEQTAIADYLDTQTSQIDRKIDLLSQKATHYGKLKQSLINETVTRGLDKTVPMKNSAVEWIGEVPAHWNVKRLKDYSTQSKEKNGLNPVGEMLSVSGYRGIEVKVYDNEIQMRTKEELADYRVVRPGQLVVNTMWLNYRGIGVSQHRGYVSPAYRAYYLDHVIVGSFLHYLMRSDLYVFGYTKYLQGIRPNSLQMKTIDFECLPIVIPDKKEQTAIANYLDEKIAHIDRIVVTINTQIDKLKELRKALINDVVTGKIKVFDDNNRDKLTTDPFDYTKGQQELDENLSIEAHAIKRCY